MLASIGVSCDCRPVEIDEGPLVGERAPALVKRLAHTKAAAVARQFPQDWVLGADTVVVCDSQLMGKPVNARHALEMLLTLNNRAHTVVSGYALVNEGAQMALGRVVESSVVFNENAVDLLRAYVATGEPLDKAGAYGIQGMGGALVGKINGSCTNIVGLPLAEVVRDLIDLGIVTARVPSAALWP